MPGGSPTDDGYTEKSYPVRASILRIGRNIQQRVKIALSAVTASFLLAVLVLIKPVSDWAGPYAFLVFFHLHIFFFPSPLTVGENLQSTILGLLGSVTGCAVGLLCVLLAHRIDVDSGRESQEFDAFTPYNSPGSRAFKNFTRICLFNSSWIITRGPDGNRIDYTVFAHFFHPTVLSAGVGVVSNFLVFPKTGVSVFIDELIFTLGSIGKLIDKSAESFLNDQSLDVPSLRTAFSASLARLGPNFEAACMEVALVRVPASAYGPYLKALKRSRGWIASGIEFENETSTAPDPPMLADLESSVRALAGEIKHAFTLIKLCVLLVTDRRLPPAEEVDSAIVTTLLNNNPRSDPAAAHRAVIQQRRELSAAIHQMKSELQSHGDIKPSTSMTFQPFAGNISAGDPDSQESSASGELSGRTYAGSYLILCLIEVAQACLHALGTTQNVVRIWDGASRRRIQWPWTSLDGSSTSITRWGWRHWANRAGPGTLNDLMSTTIADKYGLEADDIFADPEDHKGRMRGEEAEEERKEKERSRSEAPVPSSNGFDIFSGLDPGVFSGTIPSSPEPEAQKKEMRKPLGLLGWMIQIPARFMGMLRTKEAIARRVRLSNTLSGLKNSRHLRFAIKLSLGCLLLTIPAWLPVEESRKWWYGERGQWALISYIWVLETSSGATVRVSIFRMIGTVSGSVYGYLVWLICGTNPYGLTVLIVLAEFFAAYMMLETNAQGIGIVFAITFPIVSLIPYLGQPYTTVAILAWTRGYMVMIGIVLALIVNLTVWPFHARVQLVRHIARATGRLQRLYLSLSRQLLNTDLVTHHETRKSFERLEASILRTLSQSRSLVTLMTAEVSLAPKPTALLGKIIDRLARIADLLIGLRLCRQHGMKGSVHKHLVLSVFDQRTELVSAVLLSLFAIEASIRNRSPLPQFLPSPRNALEELTTFLREKLEHPESMHTPATPVPDAFHALNSLQHRRADWRRHHLDFRLVDLRTSSPLTRTPPLGFATPRSSGILGPEAPVQEVRSAGTSMALPQTAAASSTDRPMTMTTATAAARETSTRGAVPDVRVGASVATPTGPPWQPPPKLAYFFLLAEHSLLAQIVSELEHLLELTRRLVGTATVLNMSYVPRSDAVAGAEDTLTQHHTWH
ncbi:hypothetical protein OC845_002197 [Tilletia horrida]|nr:hypothetical protein OC845_002197 [Tilletia horrida]